MNVWKNKQKKKPTQQKAASDWQNEPLTNAEWALVKDSWQQLLEQNMVSSNTQASISKNARLLWSSLGEDHEQFAQHCKQKLKTKTQKYSQLYSFVQHRCKGPDTMSESELSLSQKQPPQSDKSAFLEDAPEV